ncbi:MAG: hypothetical protein HZB09_01620 [Candidatus Yonathbacteria bacterium]|nr:hypothetical protein [Candidatus Yonathbacteria bacterium]
METIKFNYKESAGISSDELNETVKSLDGYRQKLRVVANEMGYDALESSINLPFDEGMHNEIEAVVATLKTPSLKYIIHIGIGGSVLGTQAIYEALVGNYDALLSHRFPKIIFVDTNCSGVIKTIRECIRDLQSPEEVMVHVISKSGTTTETIANFEVIHAILKERFGEIKNRVVVTTDEGSKLWTAGTMEGFAYLSIPKNVGGRYSVLSAAGVLSLSLAGIDTRALREGASLMREHCLEDSAGENMAMISAAILFHHYQKGISTHNSFFFSPELESLGKWYRQLVGESLGKEKVSANGDSARIGITPIVSIGSNDLHSVAQLYLGGPKDKFTTFVHRENGNKKTEVPTAPIFSGLVPGIAGKDFSEITNAIYGGVLAAYRKRALPFVEIIFPEISAKTLGAYVQFKMIETMYLAHLLGVNAFDQPNVEEYKAETRKMLEAQ